MRKRIAIGQSDYIPWKGYFDLINSVDEFILYDDMQYTRRDWRNRNKIKTTKGTDWLTIPVKVRGKYFQKIKDTEIGDPLWNQKHWKNIAHNYAQARCFNECKEFFQDLYLGANESFLSLVNYRFIAAICHTLGIRTKISWSMEYHLVDGKTERLVSLCQQAGAFEYVSGPTARGYIDEPLFEKSGIILRYMDYSGYREYPQIFPPFDHHVSVIDLILNVGKDAPRYMKSF